eukprot:scaffold24085_cov19-Tisochrysis_lutea.AAC.2
MAPPAMTAAKQTDTLTLVWDMGFATCLGISASRSSQRQLACMHTGGFKILGTSGSRKRICFIST